MPWLFERLFREEPTEGWAVELLVGVGGAALRWRSAVRRLEVLAEARGARDSEGVGAAPEKVSPEGGGGGAGGGPVTPVERRVANTLPSAVLLALAGGSLDAFLYLNHGHVFAGAMTGNAVLCGIAVLTHHAAAAVQHLLPIVAFFVGVWLAELLQSSLKHHAISVGLLAEACGLLLCSVAPPGFPNLVFVPLVSLLAAYQVASFRKVDAYSYNSTFITGDLRTLVVGLFEARQPEHREAGLRQARELGLIVAGFLLGAVAGAAMAPRSGNHTLWFPAALLLLVLGSTLWRSRYGPVPRPAEPAD